MQVLIFFIAVLIIKMLFFVLFYDIIVLLNMFIKGRFYIMTKRDSKFELLRIFAMFIIIVSHLSFHGLVQHSYTANTTFINERVNFALTHLGSTGVGIFFLLAGYFGVGSDNIHFKSLGRICINVIVYSVLGLLGSVIYMGSIGAHIDVVSFISCFFPITNAVYWYASAYILLMLLKPQVNLFVNKIKKSDYFIVIFICFIIYSFASYLDSIYANILEGVFYYIVGAGIFLHVDKLAKIKSVFFFLTGIIFVVLHLPILAAILFFMCFHNMKGFYNNKINIVAKSTFSIYLIHEHVLVRDILWGYLFNSKIIMLDLPLYICYCLLVCICIFVGCMFIDFFIQFIFNLSVKSCLKSFRSRQSDKDMSV